ncbi:MAG: diacylglycerol/polyprenol kinase family protein, partial [Nanoarchaeota archaeon]
MQNKKIGAKNFEISRQMFHLALGLVIALLLMHGFIGKNLILIFIIVGLILSYLSTKSKIPIIYNLLQKFERKNDLEKFPGKGIIFYFIGVYISLLLFPREIAMASIMVLAFGDSVSHVYGLHYGKIKHPLSNIKFLEGTIAGFIAGFIGAWMFLPWHEAFFASFIAMIIEAVEIKIGAEQVDDNLIIPVVAGAVVWVIRL